MKRNRLYYFTVEDESLLAEVFPQFGEDVHAIAYKVEGTEDVFVTTAETKEAMDRHDIPYNCLAEEDGNRIAILHTELSREELAEHEDALRALALAYRSIGLSCIGVNGDTGLDFSDADARFSYFTAPAGHTFLWRLFAHRDDAVDYAETRDEEPEVAEWAEALPLISSDELVTYH